MKHLDTIQTYFFLGIGGIGMSAIARYMMQNNKQVLGYDRTATDLTHDLINEGIIIYHNEEDAITALNNLSKETTCIIYTPAISKQSNVWQYYESQGLKGYKRAEILGKITQNNYCIAVAGTHGKTTTSSILTHVLKENEVGVTAFLGGILSQEKTNYISTGQEVYVVEADEYDRSFLQLHPNLALITSTDADHLEIYGSKEALFTNFEKFASQVSQQVFTSAEVTIPGIKIGFDTALEVHASNIRVEGGKYVFDMNFGHEKVQDVALSLPGKHNLFNAMAAVAMAAYYLPEKLHGFARSLASFQGVQRRFNYLFRDEKLHVVDDYAHHPTEIAAAFQAAQEMHPNTHRMVIFQPHLFSRTQEFADDFAQSLQLFDEVYLVDIYPAREEPIPGINAEFLAKKITHKPVQVIEKQAMYKAIQDTQCQVVLLLGAGDIGVEAQRIKKLLAS